MSFPLRFSCAATSFLRDLPPRLVRLPFSSFLTAGCAIGSSIGFPVRVLLMLVLRSADFTVLSSLSCSSASAMSSDEKGPSRVAALGFLTLRCFPAPTYGEVFLGKGAVLAAGIGFIGVAGASWGGPDGGCAGVGAAEVRLPILRMAGSTKGCGAGRAAEGADGGTCWGYCA
jgi:hypothetical protein